MSNVLGLAVFAVGIVLLIWGFTASPNLGPDLSRFLAGTAAERPLWLVVGGAIAVIGGLILALRGPHQS